VKVRQVEVQLQEVAQGRHYLESKQRRADNLTRRRYVSCVEKLVISSEIVQEISRCLSPSTKPDSGASCHMTPVREILVDYVEFEKPQIVCLGDGLTVGKRKHPSHYGSHFK